MPYSEKVQPLALLSCRQNVANVFALEHKDARWTNDFEQPPQGQVTLQGREGWMRWMNEWIDGWMDEWMDIVCERKFTFQQHETETELYKTTQNNQIQLPT